MVETFAWAAEREDNSTITEMKIARVLRVTYSSASMKPNSHIKDNTKLLM